MNVLTAPKFHATWFLAFFAAGVAFDALAQYTEFFAPKAGPSPAVILISGVSGPALYRDYGRAVAELGYVAVLVSGKDVSNQSGESAENFNRIVASVRADPRVRPGKVAVVGFSLGGGGALLYAANRADVVASVVAYYPAVAILPSIAEAARRVSVPTLVLAGEKDRYNRCCFIESIREFETAARAAGAQVTVVAYPDAEHGFNLKVPTFRAADAADAWARTQ